MLNRRPGSSAFCWLLYHILSLTPSYIIVQSPTQSPTQSLEWHVWLSSSGNNCHAVHRSLSSGASVYECIMGFTLSHFFSQIRLRDFFRLLAIGMRHFLPVHHFGMACLAWSKVNTWHIIYTILMQSQLRCAWFNWCRRHLHFSYFLVLWQGPSTYHSFCSGVYWPSTRPNMPFQSDAPERSDTFRWQLWKKSRRRAWLTKWDKVKSRNTVIDWCTGREWPVNCMTVISAWWRSNMPFKRLSGRLNYYIPRWRQEVS